MSISFDQLRNDKECELAKLVAKEVRPILSKHWWHMFAVRYVMRNPDLRTQLLRFADVFPAIRTSAEAQKHFRDYLVDGLPAVPFLFRVADVGGKFPFGRRVESSALRFVMRLMARHFMVSSVPRDMRKTVSGLRKLGAKCSFDILGEQILSEKEARDYQEKYLDLVCVLIALGGEVNLSLKLSSLDSQFDPLAREATKEKVKGRLRPIMFFVQNYTGNGALTIDMEQFYFRDLTWSIVKDILSEGEFRGFSNFGIAHQTYLLDSEEFLESVVRFAKERNTPLSVRLVKGAYWDYEVITAHQKNWPVPVYTSREQTDASFERNVDIALKSYPALKVAVGSHNISSLAYVMARHEVLGLPQEALEFQVLYGLGSPLVKPLIKMGYRVRVYVGMGNMAEGMSYLARRLLENTSQISSAFFAIKEKKGEGVDGHAF